MQVTALLVLAAALGAAADKPKADAKKDLDRLQGTWVMVGLEVNGETVPEKKIAGTTLVIRDDRYIVKVKDTTHETTFKLFPDKDPKAIDMYFPNGPELPRLSKGLYRLDGDTLEICRHQAPGEERPTQIGTRPDTNLFIVTWKRQKP